MNKTLLLKRISNALEVLLQGAVNAALQACDTATNKETVAESKYDTFGLEASYLAQGQAKRVAEYKADIAAFKNVLPTDFSGGVPIAIGAFVVFKDALNVEKTIFLSPAAGGLKLQFNKKDIMLISRSSSLAVAMCGSIEGDEFEIDIDGKKTCYEIISVT